MTSLWLASFILFAFASITSASTKPHIVFVLVDDWGFADVSFRNPAIYTPNFQMLADNGLILNRHYVFKYCSPSRASFLTGRWPHHCHQWNPLPNAKVGANINMTMIPAKLKTVGYKTHMVGKWHEGFYDPAFLPINRGFDSSSGFLLGMEDHFTQVRECAVDYWRNDHTDTRNGTYDSYIYKDDLTEIITNHDPSTPMFLYLPLHNVHGPLQAPDEWEKVYPANSTCDQRRTYQAMVSVADNVTGHVVELLKKQKMWDNTILVVSADNGGCGGSNYPLKGSKMTFFEGGVRSSAFASGGLVPESRRGKSTDGFIHIADWYTTFCKLAGVDHDDSGTGKFPVDGTDVWPIITGENEKTLHDEIVLGYDFDDRGALIAGNYKLIVGSQDKQGCANLMYTPIDSFCKKGIIGGDCTPYCLYDIINDPNENNDLSKTHTDVLKQLLTQYNRYSQEPRHMQDQGYHTIEELPSDSNACNHMNEHGGYWQPWKN